MSKLASPAARSFRQIARLLRANSPVSKDRTWHNAVLSEFRRNSAVSESGELSRLIKLGNDFALMLDSIVEHEAREQSCKIDYIYMHIFVCFVHFLSLYPIVHCALSVCVWCVCVVLCCVVYSACVCCVKCVCVYVL